METLDIERVRQNTSFRTLLTGIFLNSPMIDQRLLSGVSEESTYNRYGPRFRHGLTIFAGLSSAEQIFLIHHLQRYFILKVLEKHTK